MLISRYYDLFASRGEKLHDSGTVLFLISNRMIFPFACVDDKVVLTDGQATEILKKLGGILIRWSDGDAMETESQEWYSVVCENFVPVESLKSKPRGEMLKGLSNFTVRRIDAAYLSQNGFEIYSKSIAGYKNFFSSKFDNQSFARNCMLAKDFDDIQHYWGVFSKTQLIGYSSVYVFDKIEALYTTIKIVPEYLNDYAAYALLYSMNEYYLGQNGFKYVNDGYRSLLHDTNIQEFLIRKFNFRKRYLKLKVRYTPWLGNVIRIIYPARSVFAGIDKRIQALLDQEMIRRSFIGQH